DRELLAQAPRREVERVDVHRDAATRDQDVLAHEARRAQDLLLLAVEQERAVAEPAPEPRVVRERARRAVDVELGVGASVPGVLERELDQLVARLVDRAAQRLEQRTALGEGHDPERRPAHVARVTERRAEIEPPGGRLRDRVARGGGVQRRGGALTGDPLVLQVALQDAHRGDSLPKEVAPNTRSRVAERARRYRTWGSSSFSSDAQSPSTSALVSYSA